MCLISSNTRWSMSWPNYRPDFRYSQGSAKESYSPTTFSRKYLLDSQIRQSKLREKSKVNLRWKESIIPIFISPSLSPEVGEAAYRQSAPSPKLLSWAQHFCSMSAVNFYRRIYRVYLTLSLFIRYSSLLPEIDFSSGTIPPRRWLGPAAVLWVFHRVSRISSPKGHNRLSRRRASRSWM